MDTRTTLPLSDARKQLASLVRGVQKPNRYFTFTQHGRPVAVMLSAKDFEAWAETLEVMREFPDLARERKEAEDDLRRGRTVTLDSYVSGASRAKGRKRSRSR